jgi:dTDP-4-dehydrorhamnose 3,5-epimerase
VSSQGNQLWVPPGWAHGTVCLSEDGTLSYFSTVAFDPSYERSLALDSEVGIEWPKETALDMATARDMEHKTLDAFWRSFHA